MTQNQKILQYVQLRGTITPLIARSEFKVEHLPSRIRDLKALGHRFSKTFKRAANGSRYAEYTLLTA